MDSRSLTIVRRVCVLLAAVVVGVGVSPTEVVAVDAEASLLHVRKNVTAMSVQERSDFVAAVHALKAARSPYDPKLNYYDQFVAWHLSLYPCGLGHEMVRAHGGPMFLPWHRMFLLRFEEALRQVSGKPIAVPYWDWADPASTASVFADDFMGGDGDPKNGYAVSTGPFRKGRWPLRVHPIGVQWTPSRTAHLTRRFGSLPVMATLPSPADVTFLLERPAYDVAPYDAGSDPNVSFRNALEGFWHGVGPAKVTSGSTSMVCGPDGVMAGTGGEGVHNRVHGWVGGLLGASAKGPKFGTMFLPSSPNDPVFFLHHSNIDRLWAEWQTTHGVDSYAPRACGTGLAERDCAANTATDRMHPPFDATPDDVADIGALGYAYDTVATARNASVLGDALDRVRATLAIRCDLL